MTTIADASRSSIGAKLVMAITGLGLVVFVLGHLAGNLQVFLGQEALNHYAEKLREYPAFLWVARLGLLALVALHIAAAVRVTRANRSARPQRYAKRKSQEASFAARTLMVSGVLIALYVVYHLLHFTTHDVHAGYAGHTDAQGRYEMDRDPQGRHDVYSMVVASFQNPMISIVYVVAMLMLSMHLSHGIGSFMQTLGWGHPRYNRSVRLLGPVTAIVIGIGYISIPVAVLLGWVDLPGGG